MEDTTIAKVTMDMIVKMPPLLVDMNTLTKLLGLSKLTIEEIIKTNPDFPQPIQFTGKSKRLWKVEEIGAFVKKLK